ncbi:MAG: hypothetical protein WB471_03725 [Nocardioides sp.]
MTAPVPEETNAALDLHEEPPGEHASELSGPDDGPQDDPDAGPDQQENAQSSMDQPSQ